MVCKLRRNAPGELAPSLLVILGGRSITVAARIPLTAPKQEMSTARKALAGATRTLKITVAAASSNHLLDGSFGARRMMVCFGKRRFMA